MSGLETVTVSLPQEGENEWMGGITRGCVTQQKYGQDNMKQPQPRFVQQMSK